MDKTNTHKITLIHANKSLQEAVFSNHKMNLKLVRFQTRLARILQTSTKIDNKYYSTAREYQQNIFFRAHRKLWDILWYILQHLKLSKFINKPHRTNHFHNWFQSLLCRRFLVDLKSKRMLFFQRCCGSGFRRFLDIFGIRLSFAGYGSRFIKTCVK